MDKNCGAAVAVNRPAEKTPAKTRASKNYAAIAEKFCEGRTGIENMRVLEVGSDVNGGLLEAMAPLVGEIVGVNILGTPRQIASNARFELGDIRHTDFADASFDLIVSFAVFEHVQDFDVAMDEMYRVLKPGGQLSTEFGPIWSCMWGHHLWAHGADSVYRYNQAPYLPPYCHLLMEPDELRETLNGTIPDGDIETVIEFVYRSDEQNRTHHREYIDTIENSNFVTKKLTSNRNSVLERAYLGQNGNAESYAQELNEKFGEADYLTASITAELLKQ